MSLIKLAYNEKLTNQKMQFAFTSWKPDVKNILEGKGITKLPPKGDPGDGKSKLMLSIVALLSKGEPLPFTDTEETEPMMHFTVEEENLICMYHTSDRRRTMARMLTALPDMDTEMRRLANGTIAKLEHMTDADFDGQRFDFTGE